MVIVPNRPARPEFFGGALQVIAALALAIIIDGAAQLQTGTWSRYAGSFAFVFLLQVVFNA